MSLVRDNRPWFKEPWPWLLMAGPLAVIAAGAVTIWLAVGSFDGLVEDDYYKQGLAVNQRLQRDHKAGELGLRADVMISGLQVRVVMTSGQYAKLPPTLNAKFIHPTRSGQDRTVVLAAEGQKSTAYPHGWVDPPSLRMHSRSRAYGCLPVGSACHATGRVVGLRVGCCHLIGSGLCQPVRPTANTPRVGGAT